MAPLTPIVLIGLLVLPATEPRQFQGTPIACDMRPSIVAYLQAKYGEHQVSWELTDKDSIKELFAGPSGTWTMLRTYTSGASCVVGAGYVGPWVDL